MKKILVVTGNRKQFDFWCCVHGVNPRDSSPFVYFSDMEKIRSCEFSMIIKYGTWYERRNIDWNVITSRVREV